MTQTAKRGPQERRAWTLSGLQSHAEGPTVRKQLRDRSLHFYSDGYPVELQYLATWSFRYRYRDILVFFCSHHIKYILPILSYTRHTASPQSKYPNTRSKARVHGATVISGDPCTSTGIYLKYLPCLWLANGQGNNSLPWVNGKTTNQNKLKFKTWQVQISGTP